MKEEKTVQEKTIVIDIKLTRGPVAALSCVLAVVGLLAYLTLTGEKAVASEVETAQVASTGMRQFYLTTSLYTGTLALTACAPGYHMASLREIADPSNLKYNTILGDAWPGGDGGQGPPGFLHGWVRTGYASDGSTTKGMANCLVWTSGSSSDYGTVVRLPYDWTAGDQDVGAWDTLVLGCNTTAPVWCIED